MDASGGIGMAANVVGGLMQSIAASQAQRAMVEAFKNEMARQGRFRAQATQGWQQGVQGQSAETAQGLMQQGQQDRMQAYQSPGSLGMGYNPSLRDSAKLQLMGKLRAALGSYGDWQQQAGITQGRTSEGINRVADQARGQASIFPYRMQDAQHSWDELSFWGQMISSIGGSAGNWGQLFGQPAQTGVQPQQQQSPWAGPDSNPWSGGVA